MNMINAPRNQHSSSTTPQSAAEQRDGEQAIWKSLGTGAPNQEKRDQRTNTIKNFEPVIRRMKRQEKIKLLSLALDIVDQDLIAAILPGLELHDMRPPLSFTEEAIIWQKCFKNETYKYKNKDNQQQSTVIDLLIEHGLKSQSIPLFGIIYRGDTGNLEKALAVGANPNQVHNSETPLICVARTILDEQRCMKMADVLLNKGAIPLVKDSIGRLPSDVARRPNTMEVHRYLKSFEDRMQLAFAAGLTSSSKSPIIDDSPQDSPQEQPIARARRM